MGVRNALAEKFATASIGMGPGYFSRYGARALGFMSIVTRGGEEARTAFGGAANMRTAIGAGAGGTYGAFSDDTSVLGGAAYGAGIGRYGFSGGGVASWKKLRSNVGIGGTARAPSGYARSAVGFMAGGALGSKRLIGSDLTKAYNGFMGIPERTRAWLGR